MTGCKRPLPPWPTFLLLFLLLALPANRHAGSNETVRFATTVRLIENGTVELGPYAARTNDVATYHGRFYNDKAPGVSLLLAPIYALVRLVSSDFDVARHACRLLSLTLLALFTAFFLWHRLIAWGLPGRLSLVAACGFVISSTAWPFFTMLYGHGFAACLILIGILLLVEYRKRNGELRLLAFSGLCFGSSIAIEYPTALLGVCAGLYLISFERRVGRVALFVALGAVLPALICGGFNYAAFGNPFHFGYSEEKYAYFSRHMSRGLMGAGLPRLDNLYLLLLSPAKGLFFWSPFLLFGLAGMIVMIARQPREGFLLFGMFLSSALFFSGYYEASGAASLGPRHLAPLVGPLVLAGAWLIGRAGPRWRGAYVGAAIFSSLLMSSGQFSEPQMPDRVVNPLWEFAVPMLAGGGGPGNLLGLPDRFAWPLALLLLVGLWVSVFLHADYAEPKLSLARAASVLGFALLAAFYLGLGPHLGETEPGMLHQVRGNHFMVRADYQQAASEYESAYATRKDPWILFYLARARALAGDDTLADQTMQRLMRAYPTFVQTLRRNRGAPLSP